MSARRIARVAIQLVGFLAGLGLLGWAVSIALSPENREQLEGLAEASIGQAALLLGLSLASIMLSGVIFWVVLAPARRLRLFDVLATNALATFLAYLPLKLSVIVRVAIHNRRDRVPVLTIGAWFMAFTLSMGAAMGALVLATIIRGRIDVVWILIALACMAALTGCLYGFGRYFGFEQGEARLHRWLDPVTPKRFQRHLRSDRFRELHDGFAMLAHGPALTTSVLLRVVDLLLQSARLVIAARVLGVELTLDGAIILSLTYFTIGVISPSGMLGVREMGTTAVASLLGMEMSDSFAAVTLLVTGSESVVSIALAGLGLAWLRPDRLFTNRRQDESATPTAEDES